jgi:hypothetical protein
MLFPLRIDRKALAKYPRQRRRWSNIYLNRKRLKTTGFSIKTFFACVNRLLLTMSIFSIAMDYMLCLEYDATQQATLASGSPW